MNTLIRILVVMAATALWSGYARAQEWPGGPVSNGGCLGSPLCGCADCRAQLRRGRAGGGGFQARRAERQAYPAQPGPVGNAISTRLRPCETVAGGYHPQALAYPPICGNQIANPYEQWPGIDCGGGYVNYGDTCCGPAWYDVAVEAVAIRRDNDDSFPLTSVGIAGPVVLSTNDADFGYKPGMRVTGRFQMNAVTNFEASTLVLLDWDNFDDATAPLDSMGNNTNSLYSIFSDFGEEPLGGFRETDQATHHALVYDSNLRSVEASFRRSWIFPRGKTHGSWLIGARYIRLEDFFRFRSVVLPHLDPINDELRPAGDLDYRISTKNDMVGLQLGSELSHCVIPGIIISGQGKLGLYGNKARQLTQIEGDPLTVDEDPIVANPSTTRFSYGSEARASLIWQFHPLVKLRGGYELLFLSRVATGAGNFSTDLPLTFPGPDPPDTEENGRFPLDTTTNLLYHGFHLGLELGW